MVLPIFEMIKYYSQESPKLEQLKGLLLSRIRVLKKMQLMAIFSGVSFLPVRAYILIENNVTYNHKNAIGVSYQ
jgi:hypothetical protein